MPKFNDDVDLDEEFPIQEDRPGRPRARRDDEDGPVYRDRRELGERPRIPDDAPRPQDRKRSREETERREASSATVMDEATGILVTTVEFDGENYTIPADPEDWPIEATLAFENGRVLSAIRGLLPAKEWAALMKKRYRNKDFAKLYEKLAKAGGFDTAGN